MGDVLSHAGRPTNNAASAPFLKCPVAVVPLLIKVFGQKRGCWREVTLRCKQALKHDLEQQGVFPDLSFLVSLVLSVAHMSFVQIKNTILGLCDLASAGDWGSHGVSCF